MSSRLFFLDLDGTLLNSKSEVSDRMREAMGIFLGHGNRIAYCTGRPVSSIRYLIESQKLPTEGCYIIAYNGAQIFECETETMLQHLGIPADEMEHIMDLAEETGVHCQAYGDSFFAGRYDGEAPRYYENKIHIAYRIANPVSEILTAPTCKLLAVELQEHERLDRLEEKVREYYGERYTTVHSTPDFLEIFPKESGKGNSVRTLCKLIGVPIEHTMGAGDAANDISMLEAVCLSIAMANADEAVKAVSKVVTERDNDSDGLLPYFLEEDLR